MFRFAFFFIALLPFLGMSQNCGECPSGFTHLPKWKKCYKAFDKPLNWSDAFKTCKGLNSHLVVVQSAEDLKALMEIIGPSRSSCLLAAIYSAGVRKCSTNEFVWATGSGTQWNMSYTNWHKGEPNNVKGQENCIRLQGKWNLEWVDVPCYVKHCFLCEVDI